MRVRKTIQTSGTLVGPVIFGNENYAVNPNRTGFTFSVHADGVHVHSDLDSDFGINRVWKHRDVAKSVDKARRKLLSYGSEITLDALIADGWSVR